MISQHQHPEELNSIFYFIFRRRLNHIFDYLGRDLFTVYSIKKKHL